MRSVHELKTHPEPFQATLQDRKLYEVREWDRDFELGDKVILDEWLPEEERYTGRSVLGEIVYVSEPGSWGLPEDRGVFGFIILDKAQGEVRDL